MTKYRLYKTIHIQNHTHRVMVVESDDSRDLEYAAWRCIGSIIPFKNRTFEDQLEIYNRRLDKDSLSFEIKAVAY